MFLNRNEEKARGTEISVAFVYYGSLSTFIKIDRDMLSNRFRVREANYKRFKDMFNLASIIAKSDISFTWFAGGHAFLAVLFSKIFKGKSIIVVGGYDVAFLPQIKYGRFTSDPLRRFMTKWALKHTDRILVVDLSLREDVEKNAGVSSGNIEYLPTGYDSEKFIPEGSKEPMAITVSKGDNWQRVLIKGLDVFVKSAYYLPEIRFLVIGVQGNALKELRAIAPRNVEFVENLSQKELIYFYQKAKVYCQISMREGLPNSLCEAMLCECIPVGTKLYGIPTAIGDTGFYVPYGNPQSTAEAIGKAIKMSNDLGKRARQRIIENFPLESREKGLAQIIEKLARDQNHGS